MSFFFSFFLFLSKFESGCERDGIFLSLVSGIWGLEDGMEGWEEDGMER